MSNWNEADHPRVDAGKSTGGQFTAADVGAAVSAAKKAAKVVGQYSVNFGYGDKRAFTVYTVPGGGTLPLEVTKALDADEALPIIYNAETNTWHVAPRTEHGDFSREAREGVDREFPEEFMARGYIWAAKGGSIEMYDHTYNLEDILEVNPTKERKLTVGIERTRRAADRNVLSFYDNRGRLVTPDITWVE